MQAKLIDSLAIGDRTHPPALSVLQGQGVGQKDSSLVPSNI